MQLLLTEFIGREWGFWLFSINVPLDFLHNMLVIFKFCPSLKVILSMCVESVDDDLVKVLFELTKLII